MFKKKEKKLVEYSKKTAKINPKMILNEYNRWITTVQNKINTLLGVNEQNIESDYRRNPDIVDDLKNKINNNIPFETRLGEMKYVWDEYFAPKANITISQEGIRLSISTEFNEEMYKKLLKDAKIYFELKKEKEAFMKERDEFVKKYL